MVLKEMQWCDDRNESRTASCQHQRVSPCEGQDKILFNVNVTANSVGLNTELCKKRVCELEEKQWRTDRDEPGSESMTEYVAPAPAVYCATPAPLIEFVTPSPVIEYSALAPSVTCFTPSPQSPLAYTMAAVTTGVTVDIARSVYSKSPIADVAASASQVTGSLHPVETINIESETSRRVNLWGAAMSDDDGCPGPRLRGAAASTTEHFDLTADDSQDECLADGMPSYEMACHRTES